MWHPFIQLLTLTVSLLTRCPAWAAAAAAVVRCRAYHSDVVVLQLCWQDACIGAISRSRGADSFMLQPHPLAQHPGAITAKQPLSCGTTQSIVLSWLVLPVDKQCCNVPMHLVLLAGMCICMRRSQGSHSRSLTCLCPSIRASTTTCAKHLGNEGRRLSALVPCCHGWCWCLGLCHAAVGPGIMMELKYGM